MQTYLISAWDREDINGPPITEFPVRASAEAEAIELGEQAFVDKHGPLPPDGAVYFTATLWEE